MGGRINGNQTLCMEWCPAQKEADDNGNYKNDKINKQLFKRTNNRHSL